MSLQRQPGDSGPAPEGNNDLSTTITKLIILVASNKEIDTDVRQTVVDLIDSVREALHSYNQTVSNQKKKKKDFERWVGVLVPEINKIKNDGLSDVSLQSIIDSLNEIKSEAEKV